MTRRVLGLNGPKLNVLEERNSARYSTITSSHTGGSCRDTNTIGFDVTLFHSDHSTVADVVIDGGRTFCLALPYVTALPNDEEH